MGRVKNGMCWVFYVFLMLLMDAEENYAGDDDDVGVVVPKFSYAIGGGAVSIFF